MTTLGKMVLRLREIWKNVDAGIFVMIDKAQLKKSIRHSGL
jgi:hypothetical protein